MGILYIFRVVSNIMIICIIQKYHIRYLSNKLNQWMIPNHYVCLKLDCWYISAIQLSREYLHQTMAIGQRKLITGPITRRMVILSGQTQTFSVACFSNYGWHTSEPSVFCDRALISFICMPKEGLRCNESYSWIMLSLLMERRHVSKFFTLYQHLIAVTQLMQYYNYWTKLHFWQNYSTSIGL